MLTETGLVRITAPDGTEWVFRPSLGRIAALATPQGIVSIYADLHGPRAEVEAAYVLTCLCDPGGGDVLALVGHWEPEPFLGKGGGFQAIRVPGLMPPGEQVLIARHLMRHGIIGKAKPGSADGKFSDQFNAAEYIMAARVHLGLSGRDAEAISMTEFQMMFEMKFPDATKKERDIPTREEYEAGINHLREIRRRALAKRDAKAPPEV